jgi:hypothetical protein
MSALSGKLGLVLVLMSAPTLALSQESGGHGESGGSGCGDVLGDLVEILRDEATGQPILQKRVVELPNNAGLGVAYCPIAVKSDGEQIGFVDLSCDPVEATEVVPVDYFGRLSGGRTKERNSRMHFDEVISSIKDPAVVRVNQDETGRLKLIEACVTDPVTLEESCPSRVIDSPMENLALYARLMKYGHLQTDPGEVDTFAQGDPAAGVQYHPALTAADYAKFDAGMRHLLPRGENDLSPADTCFPGGVWSADSGCATGERLGSRDFIRAGSFLAGAADKGGKVTVDLVQYMNRILKITLDTEISTANVLTRPALIRDCGEGANAATNPVEAAAAEGISCGVKAAASGLPAPADERFVNFRATSYERGAWRDRKLEVLKPILGTNRWQQVRGVRLMDWLGFINGSPPSAPATEIDGFVQATSDGLRSIQFVHNYAIPEDLWDFVSTNP